MIRSNVLPTQWTVGNWSVAWKEGGNVGGLWGALVPNIDYMVTYTLEQESAMWTISLDGKHNDFPDYEARVMNSWIYWFHAPATGPGIFNPHSSTSFSTAMGAFH